ncbi:hypothetical protein SB96558_2437 [Shigella boydii 965-58]|nr:hypothetical protein SB96558_2437 [Shigella boydii 965-58]
MLCHFGQTIPGGKRIQTFLQREKTTLTGMLRTQWQHRARQPGQIIHLLVG